LSSHPFALPAPHCPAPFYALHSSLSSPARPSDRLNRPLPTFPSSAGIWKIPGLVSAHAPDADHSGLNLLLCAFLRENPHRLRGRVNPCRRRRYPLLSLFAPLARLGESPKRQRRAGVNPLRLWRYQFPLKSPTPNFPFLGRDLENPGPPVFSHLGPSLHSFTLLFYAFLPPSLTICSFRPVLTVSSPSGPLFMGGDQTANGGLALRPYPRRRFFFYSAPLLSTPFSLSFLPARPHFPLSSPSSYRYRPLPTFPSSAGIENLGPPLPKRIGSQKLGPA
jgi:hypothetical protein